MVVTTCPLGRGDFSLTPENIFAFDSRPIGINAIQSDPAASNLAAIDQNEATESRNAIVVIQNERRTRLDCYARHFVALNLIPRLSGRFQRRRIHDLFDGCDPALHILRDELQRIRRTDLQGFSRHPKEVGMEAIRLNGRVAFM